MNWDFGHWRSRRCGLAYASEKFGQGRVPVVLAGVVSECNAGLVGMKLSTGISMGRIIPTKETLPTCEHLVSRISDMKLAWIHLPNRSPICSGLRRILPAIRLRPSSRFCAALPALLRRADYRQRIVNQGIC